MSDHARYLPPRTWSRIRQNAASALAGRGDGDRLDLTRAIGIDR